MKHRSPLRLEWSESRGSVCLKISGWTESELRELNGSGAAAVGRRLSLFTSESLAGGNHPSLPSVAGRFTLAGEAVNFVPRFPFVAGTRYSLLVDPGAGGMPECYAILRPPPQESPTTEVLGIFPTTPTVPVNLLRVYVKFSAPMSEGWAGRAIRVCRESTGASLEGVFLPPEPELWDPQRERLTMLLDPGRIKRGLVPNLEMGYPLAEGEPIRVVISPEFRDAAGQTLKAGLERRYQVGPALRSRINPGRWQLTPPVCGTLQPLVVNFGRPMDHALLLHTVWVGSADGKAVPGTALPGKDERSWRFAPSAPWEMGEHQLVIEPHLEDVAGNTPVRVFDRDVLKPEDAPLPDGNLAIRFRCLAGT